MKLNDAAQRILAGLATDADFEGVSNEDLIAIKGDTSEMHTRFVPAGESIEVIRAVGDKESRPRFKHVASDESVDAMGDIIQVAGWQLERFEKNPQLLWAHDARGLPVGVVEKVHKGRAKGSKALLTESVLHSEDLNPMAPMVERLIESGALPGVSVGFIPKEIVFPKSQEERDTLGLGPWGVLHKVQELLELSVVPVPANANALQRSMIERADAVFADECDHGTDKELVEHVRAALCMTEAECRRIRRRTIVVPDLEAACAKLIETTTAAPQSTPEPVQDDGPVHKLTSVVAKLTTAVETLTQKSTEEAASVETESAPDVPADAGRDFLLHVARATKERLSG
jgi:HK97 family phage prohead protease